MFFRKKHGKEIEDYTKRVENIQELIKNADAIVIGAGAGLSASAGLEYGARRFQTKFPDFYRKYKILDMQAATIFQYESPEEYWAYWSRHVYYNRYELETNETYQNLKKLVEGKNYFVITTNTDALFLRHGFDENRIHATYGDYGFWQCSTPCHNGTYDNKEQVLEMVERQREMKVPTNMIPRCPKCGKEMTVNLRKGQCFVEGAEWNKSRENYEAFIKENMDKNILFLELGVGNTIPEIIKYPFWRQVNRADKARYVALNLGQAFAPRDIIYKSICVNVDIGEYLKELLS